MMLLYPLLKLLVYDHKWLGELINEMFMNVEIFIYT